MKKQLDVAATWQSAAMFATINHQRFLQRPTLVAVKRAVLFCVLFSAFSFRASAQYSIDWFTIDGGGGTSTGGVYSVSGTIGQPDANAQPMTAGNFSLVGGFWSLFA